MTPTDAHGEDGAVVTAAARTLLDDLGAPVPLPVDGPRRIVSLVPSLTEAIAATARDRLVGATDWCTHPADLDVPRVRGTKNPDLAAIAALDPDLVVVNQEENRRLDVERLRDRGIPVWVTVIESVDQALASMRRLFVEALGVGEPGWLGEAARVWADADVAAGAAGAGVDGGVPARRPRVAIAIWRDPWMVVGGRTYTADLLDRLGFDNAFGDAAAAGSTRPGSVGPGSTRPGSVGPGSTRPGSVGPGSTQPGSVGPGSARPGSVGPGSARPGSVGPGSARPGSVGPGSARPASVGPGSPQPALNGPGSTRDSSAGGAARYPRVDVATIRKVADLVVLPDEPYAFGPQDGPEAFLGGADAVPTVCVDGRAVSWYGPAMVGARGYLEDVLAPWRC